MRNSSARKGTDTSRVLKSACQHCFRRKTKCDRTFPCGQCVRSHLQCETHERKRRRTYLDEQEAVSQTWARLARLERMIGNLNPRNGRDVAPGSQTSISDQERLDEEHSLILNPRQRTVDALASQCIGSPIWASLAGEVQALREVLEEQYAKHMVDNASSNSQDAPSDLIQNHTRAHDFIFCPPSSVYVISPGMELSKSTQLALCSFFCEYVDRVFKIFHVPTLRNLLELDGPYLGQDRAAPCNVALRAAIHFAATITMSESQLCSLFGQSCKVQKEYLERMVDIAFAEADLLNTNDLATLQALVIYIAVARSTDRRRRCWTLVAVAVRIARAMGLEHDDAVHSPFESELRRRLWHQLRLLDTFCSSDRGTTPLIESSSFTVAPPLELNDRDFGDTSQLMPEPHSHGITDMSLGRLSYDAVTVAHELAVVGTASLNPQIWEQRMGLAFRFSERVRESYINFCDLSNPFHRLIHATARTTVHSMMLRAVRPVGALTSANPPKVDDPKVLIIATGCLKASEEVYNDEETEQWRWMIWIQWHALAVALSSLCGPQELGLATEAWTWIDAAFARYPLNIADGVNGMLWSPMKHLYDKARDFQANYANSSGQIQPWQKSSSVPRPNDDDESAIMCTESMLLAAETAIDSLADMESQTSHWMSPGLPA